MKPTERKTVEDQAYLCYVEAVRKAEQQPNRNSGDVFRECITAALRAYGEQVRKDTLRIWVGDEH